MSFLTLQLQKLKEYDDLADISGIARRYFAMNTFDGLLTIIGVFMGNYIARVTEPRVIISTGLATSLAMGISGLWGAYLTEAAERKRSLDELEDYTLTDLTDTRIGQASRLAVVIVAVVDGLSPFMAALFTIVPFFFARFMSSMYLAYYLSLLMALLALFVVGAFLGTISRENVVFSGIKMIGAGVASILLSLVLRVSE